MAIEYKNGPAGVFQKKGEVKTRVTFSPCDVIGFCRDGESENWGLMIEWEDRDGLTHRQTFPTGRLHERGLLQELANLGLNILPHMEKSFLAYLASRSPKTRYRAAARLGWQKHQDIFLLPAGALGQNEHDEVTLYIPKVASAMSVTIHKSGALEGWQRRIGSRVIGNPVLVFWISAAFAAPLLRLVGLESGGFHLYGLTSRGKTTVEQLAASVWGDGSDPAQGGASYVHSWNLTKNATEGLAELHNDLPLLLDEVGEADAQDFDRMIYQISGGQGKARMNRTTGLDAMKTWCVMLLSTGEIPTAEVTHGGGRRFRGGQGVRLVDIPATNLRTGKGIIVTKHDARSRRAYVDDLKRASGRWYGTAGPRFIEALLKEGLPAVRKRLCNAMEAMIVRLTPRGASPEVSRALKRIALVAVAGAEVQRLGIVPWGPDEVHEATQEVVDRFLTHRKGHGSDIERALDALRAYILKHGRSRFTSRKAPAPTVHQLAGYRDQFFYYFTPGGFKDACPDHQPDDVARLLKEKGLLDAPDKDHLTKRLLVEKLGRVRLYAVSVDILKE
jgi:putative DNA primase/helicase